MLHVSVTLFSLTFVVKCCVRQHEIISLCGMWLLYMIQPGYSIMLLWWSWTQSPITPRLRTNWHGHRSSWVPGSTLSPPQFRFLIHPFWIMCVTVYSRLQFRWIYIPGHQYNPLGGMQWILGHVTNSTISRTVPWLSMCKSIYKFTTWILYNMHVSDVGPTFRVGYLGTCFWNYQMSWIMMV